MIDSLQGIKRDSLFFDGSKQDSAAAASQPSSSRLFLLYVGMSMSIAYVRDGRR